MSGQDCVTGAHSHLAELRTASRSIVVNPRVKIDLSKTQYPVVRQAAN